MNDRRSVEVECQNVGCQPEAASTSGAAFKGAGFQWRDFDAYLFDIDGTLLNSRDAVHYHAFLSALLHLSGRALNLEGVTVQGSTDPLILLDALVLAGLAEAAVRCS